MTQEVDLRFAPMKIRLLLLIQERGTGGNAKPEPDARRKKKTSKPKKRHDVSDRDTTNGCDSIKDTESSSKSHKEEKIVTNKQAPIRLWKKEKDARI